jgi:Spy/CpxP family protein refolding chaperone
MLIRVGRKIIMKKIVMLVSLAVAAAAMQLVTQAQINPAAPGGGGGRSGFGGGGFGGFGGFGGGGLGAPAPSWIEPGYNDHQNMMDQLGIKSLRPGKSGSNQTGPGFEEATANDWMPTMPDALTMKDGTKVTTPEQWWTKRRPEILEDFEREVYGRIPADVPKVTWEVTGTSEGESGGVPTITKTLVGHVDNSAFTNITVNIQASFTVPANAPGPVPVLIQFGGGFGGGFGGAGGGFGGRGGGFGGPLTADQTTKLNAGITTAQADLTVLQDKLTAAQKDVVTALLAKDDDATIQAKLKAVANIQTDIAMLRYTKGVSEIAPSITEAQKTTISTTPGQIYTTLFAAPPPAAARGGLGGARGGGGLGGFGGGAGGGIPQEAISHGWGYGTINPGSIQADSGGNSLREGIIGLANKGKPRTPEQWGALRAWGWGVGRLIDYFQANPDSKVDPTKVGIEGVSRYGKAALVTEAFDPRVAVALVGSSGEGGAKLNRHNYGEAVENLTDQSEYHWMAGNFLKYGASDINGKSMNASDLPVDSHELIALCAPRPCFISDGSESGGDPKWIDHPGTYRAGILASKVYELLGKKGYGDDITDWIHAPLPPVGTLVGNDLAFRQHSGGHTDGPNVPFFFNWVGSYIKSPMPAAAPAPSAN